MRLLLCFCIQLFVAIGFCSIAFEGYELPSTSALCSKYQCSSSGAIGASHPTVGTTSTTSTAITGVTNIQSYSGTSICITVTVSMTTTATITSFVTVTAGVTTTTKVITTEGSTSKTIPNQSSISVDTTPAVSGQSSVTGITPTPGGASSASSTTSCGHTSASYGYNSASTSASLTTTVARASYSTISSTMTTGTETTIMETEASGQSAASIPDQTVVSGATVSAATPSQPVSQFSAAATTWSPNMNLSVVISALIILLVAL